MPNSQHRPGGFVRCAGTLTQNPLPFPGQIPRPRFVPIAAADRHCKRWVFRKRKSNRFFESCTSTRAFRLSVQNERFASGLSTALAFPEKFVPVGSLLHGCLPVVQLLVFDVDIQQPFHGRFVFGGILSSVGSRRPLGEVLRRCCGQHQLVFPVLVLPSVYHSFYAFHFFILRFFVFAWFPLRYCYITSFLE